MASLILVVSALGTAWWWVASPQSLGQALNLAARYLPAGQSLATRDVQGSLLAGGSIGWLRWQSPSLKVEVTDIRIGWQLRPLLAKRLHIGDLSAAQVVAEPVPPAPGTPAEPLQPLTGITLPLDVDVSFKVRQLRWAGAPALEAKALEGRYRYEAQTHRLDIAGVEVADGHYQGSVKLQGPAPMAIESTLAGEVQAPVPHGVAPLAVRAEARVTGTLATADARLALTARLAPEPQGGTAATMQADARAELAPWASQPLLSAHADFKDIDAARLWPGAPRTLLSGKLDAGPVAGSASSPQAATQWQAQLTARNSKSGPWDTHELPVTAIEASVSQVGTRWDIPKATLWVGDGRLSASGSWSPAPAPWRIDASLSGVQPKLLHTQLDATPVNGTVKVEQRGDATRFDLALQAESAPRAQVREAGAGAGLLGGFRIDRAAAQGQWANQTLVLRTLRIDAGPAHLSGQLTARIAAKAGEGKLALVLPGGNAQVEGRMAARAGDLKSDLAITDAAAAQRWIQSLPGLDQVFAGVRAQGTASLNARLEGGWQTLQDQFADTTVPVAGLRLQASLQAPRLDLQLPTGTPIPAAAATPVAPVPPSVAPTTQRVRLADLRVDVSGTPADATISMDGSATQGSRTLSLATRATAALATGAQYQFGVSSLRLRLADSARAEATPWQLVLDAPARISVRRPTPRQNLASNATLQVEASAASASLSGPVPGSVRIAWQPLQFSSQPVPTGSGAPGFRLRSQGTLSGLPMAWAEALGADLGALDQAGVRGDLVFDGSWDIDAGQGLRARARLARRSGDIQILVGGTSLVRRIHTQGTGTASETRYDNGRSTDATPTPAGVRQAALTLDAQDGAVRAQLTWDSERAGQINADLRTTLRQADGAWYWPDNAPLSGALKANLPSIGAWSFLAPPAWRIEGSLAADAALAGDRQTPQWSGTLRADALALKIPVEGVDLRDGRLRATLQGNRLHLDEFLLKGGPASRARIAGPSGNLSTVSSEAARDGGTVRIQGDMEWGAATPTSSAIRMALVADLQSLRVLVRSDRQISTSGQLRADLAQGQLTLRGRLAVDRGVVILPEETAPSLGPDVTIHSAAKDREIAAKAAKLQKASQVADERADTPQALKPPDIAVTVNLGNDFAVQGLGITTRLGGEIEVSANAGTRSQPRITGEIRTVNGRYRAYGQELNVESGILRFYGPYTNPSLDILALRPNIAQRAGVRIVGTAESPRLQLYSQPQLADAEALAWIVLGRSAAGGGADAAVMQQAALALLSGLGPKGGGNFASRFGLDEIGFKGPSSNDSVRSSAITVGKRISDKLYVTYEHSLAGALGTFYVFYDLTQRLALRGQAGTRSAVDLIYTWSFD